MDLGEFIALERSRRGWTLDDLAQRSKVHRSTIFKIEQGRVRFTRPDNIDGLADAFGLDRETLHRLARGVSIRAKGSASPTLTPDELRLLTYFRSLPEADRQAELAYIDQLLRRRQADESD